MPYETHNYKKYLKNNRMRRNFGIKKIVIIVISLAIIAVGLLGLNGKFNFLSLSKDDLAGTNESDSSSPSSNNSSNNSGAALPSSGQAGSLATSSSPANLEPSQPAPKSILLSVPFFSQAPFGEWSDPIFQNACEEASIIMAMHWVNKIPVTKDQVKQEILDLSLFEDKTYGQAFDRAAADAIKMFKDYFNYENVFVRSGISTKDIKKEILAGRLVIVPLNGQILKNPFYTPPGPEHHMLVVIGYDAKTNEFITNDVGTRHGEKYRYAEARLQASLQDYPTGNDLPSIPGQTAMIVVMPK